MGDKCPSHNHREDEAEKPGSGPFAPWSDGKRYWRSLDEAMQAPSFLDKLHREFPRYASEWIPPGEADKADVTRRNFLKVVGASVALASSAGCFRKPQQQIVPYVQQPEMIQPGISLHFATALPFRGYARGVVVRSDEGRPTKIEGNELHPSSLGSTDAITQGMLLDLYDPDRSQSVINDGEVSGWDNLLTDPKNGIGNKLDALKASGGKGLVIMTQTITSPTLGAMLSEIFQKLPNAKWHLHEPVSRANVKAGAETAFGKGLGRIDTVYSFDKADVVLSLDGNFLADEPGSLAYARQFIDRRRVREDRRSMNRLYVAEGTFSITGTMADHRLAIKPSRVAVVAQYIAGKLGAADASAASLNPVETKFADAVAADLMASAGSSLVVVGESQPAAVHALAHAMNARLGNIGKTVYFVDSAEVEPAGQPTQSLADLAASMNAGEVEMLVILGANPVYSAPAELDFAAVLKKFSLATDSNGYPRFTSIHHGTYEDETAFLCQWHLPATHAMEEWGDLRGHDGTISFVQPLIHPLYDGRSAIEVVNLLTTRLVGSVANRPRSTGLETAYELVRAHWQQDENWTSLTSQSDFEIFWETCLHDGVVPNTASKPRGQFDLAADATAATQMPAALSGMEISFRPDPSIWDGRYANNGWLQELPKPLTKLTWDNSVMLSVATATKLGLNSCDVVSLQCGGQTISGDQIAIWIVPGHPDDCVTVNLGFGRTKAGRVGNGAGFNAYALRTAANPDFAGGLQITKIDAKYLLVSTQGSQSMEGRDLIRVGPPDFAYDSAKKDEGDSQDDNGGQPKGVSLPVVSMYAGTPDHEDGKDIDPRFQAWGMVIDNNACIGCNACVVACQAENNIPVVGKDQTSRGREMHWLRVDTYFQGAFDDKGVPANPVPDNAAEDSTNRGASSDSIAMGPGLAGNGAPATDVHAYFEPIPCMQCEKAPCELVCPVGATVHDVEGINNMVYNRCVGTRYCSNNCPYKVRRFNFFYYGANEYNSPQSLALGRNPDVTVRTRGVMEKCNYCIQRISAGRIAAKKSGKYTDDGKPIIEDGTVQTACQQVCPTKAISFGDIGDENAQVRKLKEEPLNYVLLEELQTKPRTSYLWRLTNPNPDMLKA
jgi:MoCo/4Fe-4S cofactor protein with predicted Tat translocation signal